MDRTPKSSPRTCSGQAASGEEDGPPGTSQNPLTGEPRERTLIGAPNQHDLDSEEPETDTAQHYHGAAVADSAPKEVERGNRD